MDVLFHCISAFHGLLRESGEPLPDCHGCSLTDPKYTLEITAWKRNSHCAEARRLHAGLRRRSLLFPSCHVALDPFARRGCNEPTVKSTVVLLEHDASQL